MENITTAYLTSDVTQQNSSSGNTSRCHAKPHEDYVKSFSLAVYSLAFLLGTTGNGLVIWFTIFRMKKTVSVIWFLHLSIADFSFTLFLPLTIVYLLNDLNWIFGTFMCKLYSAMTFINMFASIFLLTVISIDRCVCVIFPVWCQNHRTPRLALFIVTAVWILAIIYSLPYFIFRDTFEYNCGYHCYYKFQPGESEDISQYQAVVIFRFIVGFFVPFTTIIACYSVIGQRMQRTRMSISTKPFKVIIAVIVSFFICWVPYHIIAFLELYSFSNNDKYMYGKIIVGIPLASSLAFMNSCVNPFLYVFIGRNFKDNFWRSIQSMQSVFEKAFSEDSVHKMRKISIKSTSYSQVV